MFLSQLVRDGAVLDPMAFLYVASILALLAGALAVSAVISLAKFIKARF